MNDTHRDVCLILNEMNSISPGICHMKIVISAMSTSMQTPYGGCNRHRSVTITSWLRNKLNNV